VHLVGYIFRDDGEVETFETGWLITQDTESYQDGMEKLTPRYDKCICLGRIILNVAQ
jgi:hypothetical protein